MNRFKATATVTWEFEVSGSQKPVPIARKQLEQAISDKFDHKAFIKVDKLKAKKHREVLGEFDADEVLPYITKEDTRRDYQVDDIVYPVRMNSQRYFVFRENRVCVSCGLVGTKMLLEQHPNDKSPHFNLYGIENEKYVLMTKDHIHAKAKGGEDRHSNYQTMCAVCNNLKGSWPLTLDAIKQMREIYNDNHNKLPKKKLNQLIEDARKTFLAESRPLSPIIIHDCEVFARNDIHIMRDASGQNVGMSVYDANHSDMIHIACIPKGMPLMPRRIGDRTLDIELPNMIFLLVKHLAEFKEESQESDVADESLKGSAEVQS